MSDPKTHDFTSCPNWGVGGRYTADPVTGVRTKVQPTESNPTAVLADGVVVEGSASTDAKSNLKEKKSG